MKTRSCHCTDERQKQRTGRNHLSALLLSLYFETQVDLRRARTCTPEDAPFNVNSMYMWYPLLVHAWGWVGWVGGRGGIFHCLCDLTSQNQRTKKDLLKVWFNFVA